MHDAGLGAPETVIQLSLKTSAFAEAAANHILKEISERTMNHANNETGHSPEDAIVVDFVDF